MQVSRTRAFLTLNLKSAASRSEPPPSGLPALWPGVRSVVETAPRALERLSLWLLSGTSRGFCRSSALQCRPVFCFLVDFFGLVRSIIESGELKSPTMIAEFKVSKCHQRRRYSIPCNGL